MVDVQRRRIDHTEVYGHAGGIQEFVGRAPVGEDLGALLGMPIVDVIPMVDLEAANLPQLSHTGVDRPEVLGVSPGRFGGSLAVPLRDERAA